MPLLLLDENGVEHGNDWARGFIRGTRLRHDGWAELLADDDHGGWMIPMLMLYHEHGEDPAMRPKPIAPEQREKVIVSMAAGLVEAYLYFRENGQPMSAPADLSLGTPTLRLGEMIHVRAVQGRSTSVAVVVRLSTNFLLPTSCLVSVLYVRADCLRVSRRSGTITQLPKRLCSQEPVAALQTEAFRRILRVGREVKTEIPVSTLPQKGVFHERRHSQDRRPDLFAGL